MPTRRLVDWLLIGALAGLAAGATARACSSAAAAPPCFDEPWAPCPLEPDPEPTPAPAPAGLEDLRDLRLTWEGCTTDLDCETRERAVLEALARRPLARGAAL